MPSLGPILDHIGPFLLVLFRLSGLFVFAPMLASPVVPARVRTLVVVVFSIALYPTIPPEQQAPIRLDVFSLLPAAFMEILIGLGIGLIASLPMYAVQLGGLIGGQQLGLGLAGIYNPAVDTESDILGQMLLYIALAVFAAVGGLELAFLSLARTFAHIPVGEAWRHGDQIIGTMRVGGQGLGDILLGLVASGFDLALRVSTPVLGIVLLETLATAFLMKTMPQLNVMSLGFASKVMLGLFIMFVSIGALGEVIGEDVRTTCDQIVRWAAGPTMADAAHGHPHPHPPAGGR